MASLYEQQQQQQQQLQMHVANNTMMNDEQHRTIYTHADNNNNMLSTPMTNIAYATTEIYPSGPILMNHQHGMIDHCNGGTVISLSEASVCSSMDIRTPDVHPVPDVALPHVTQTTSYGDVVYNHQNFAQSHELPSYVLHDPVVVWSNPTTATNNNTVMDNNSMDTYSAQLSRSSSIISIKSAAQQQQQNQYTMTESSSPSSSSLSADDMLYQLDSTNNHADQNMIMQQVQERLDEEQEQLVATMRKSINNRRYTLSYPPRDKNSLASKNEEGETTFTEKELRRQSMNDILPNSFCHLSREQLIERVVQLEKEKQLTSNKLLLESKPSTIATSESKTTLLDINNNSDEDDCIHNCLWAGCDTSAISLDQLINHIKDVHIGGGKAAYYCEWINCSRERKPFLKRHKMQNHMRTHTGERPFECTIEDCDKRFSRQDSLNTHIKTHSSIRPYACPVESCGKAYFHSRSLRKHAKSHEVSAMVNINTEKNHPYDRSLKPPPKYHQTCGTATAISTPTSTTTNTFYITPTNNTATTTTAVTATTATTTNAAANQPIVIQQQQQQQQQQIFAAGSAYVPYNHQLQPQQHYYTQPYIVSNNTTTVAHPSYANTFYEQHQYSY